MTLPPEILTYPVQHPSEHFLHLWNCLFNTLVGIMSFKTSKYCTHWSVVATGTCCIVSCESWRQWDRNFIKVGLTRKSLQISLIYKRGIKIFLRTAPDNYCFNVIKPLQYRILLHYMQAWQKVHVHRDCVWSKWLYYILSILISKSIYHTKKITHGLPKNVVCDNLNIKYY